MLMAFETASLADWKQKKTSSGYVNTLRTLGGRYLQNFLPGNSAEVSFFNCI